MCAVAVQKKARVRRGTVMVMVVGVLAMLFIIGSTLLIVGRFDRQTVRTSASGRDLQAAGVSLTDPLVLQLRVDLLGTDGIPYNNEPVVENENPGDYGDYPGNEGSSRKGDLMLAAIEPHDWRKNGENWTAKWFAVTALQDDGAAKMGLPAYLVGDPSTDADADGIADSDSEAFLSISQMFGGAYTMHARLISHGGMVLMSPYTHPALRGQVIHPKDGSDGEYFKNPASLPWASLDLTAVSNEGEIRRRFSLPRALDPASLPATDLRRYLGYTFGYYRQNKLQPHWWPFDVSLDDDKALWNAMYSPGPAPTQSNYSANNDSYDRRRFITWANSDDVLRPQRYEDRLLVNNGIIQPFRQFYDIINPQSASTPAGYGIVGPAGAQKLEFNAGSLRTQFSLRDVLEPVWVDDPGYYYGSASYRRAMQLTAYFLAMIQKTSVPGSTGTPDQAQLEEQLRTAAQLAVNAIDFADADFTPTFFRYSIDWDGAGPNPPVNYDFIGVEKQPYITEAYAKIVHKPLPPNNDTWDSSAPSDESIYAVELYNPYSVDLSLAGYSLKLEGGATISLSTVSIPAKSYIVLANRADDVTNPAATLDPFVPGTHVVKVSQNLDPQSRPQNFFAMGSDLELNPNESISLVRNSVNYIDPAGFGTTVLAAGDLIPDGSGDVLSWIEVDRMDTTGGLFAKGADPATADPPTADPPYGKDKDRLVRDSSLQRHKEWTSVQVGTLDQFIYPPVYWHFTLSRHMEFPLRWYEHPQYPNPLPPTTPSPLATDKTRPAQHNLLGTAAFTGRVVIGNSADAVLESNQSIVAREFDGFRVAYDQNFAGVPFAWTDVTDPPLVTSNGNVFDPKPVGDGADPTKLCSIAAFPVVTGDRGVDPGSGGTIAFPTTGTMLLVTRHAHLPVDPLNPGRKLPMTVAAARSLAGVVQHIEPDVPFADQNLGQMIQLDNGHLPVFDTDQVCMDGAASRLQNVPWGQLVFDYFTALPLEEKARGVAAWGSESRMENYPVVDRTDGTRVLGRINVGVAPWWVLDGLPVLPDRYLQTNDPKFTSPLLSLPVPELQAFWLDLQTMPVGSMAGAWFSHKLIDEWYGDPANPANYPKPLTNANLTRPPAGFPSISPVLAKHMVSYRENRTLDDGTIDARKDGQIGMVSVGELCSVVPKTSPWPQLSVGPKELTKPTLWDLQVQVDTNTNTKPFGYLGYLQRVAPIVRMQDWTTVKSHVYTVYATIQSTSSQPPITVRTQVTVDRTRCLYQPSELPERITETPPISYYNAMDD